MIMLRDAVLTATILALILIAAHRPPPPVLAKAPVETPYCPVDVLQAMKHPLTGKWITGWGSMYRPCSEQDRFHFI